MILLSSLRLVHYLAFKPTLLTLNPLRGLWVDLHEVCSIVSFMDQSPDGLDFTVRTEKRVVAKFCAHDDAMKYWRDWEAWFKREGQTLIVLQYDADFSPHLGRKIAP